MRRIIKFSGLLVILLAGALSPVLYRKTLDYFKTSAAPKQQGCCANQPATLRRMVETYYTTEDNFKSTLILNNKGPHQIVVTPILHGQDGQTYKAPPIAVSGLSAYEVDLNAIAASAGPQFRSGSLEFTYSGRMLEMGGGVRIVDSKNSLVFDEQMLEPGMKFSSPRLEAVFAIPFESAKVKVILTNTTAQVLSVGGSALMSGSGNQLPIQTALKPYQSQVLNLPVKDASPGAVSLK